MINQIFSQLSNLIKKPMFRKVQFDYLGFYKFLRDNKENELIISLLNGVNLEKDYSLEINRKLEEVFMSLIEFMINKDSEILNRSELYQIANKIHYKIEQKDFNGILGLLNLKINLTHFQKLLIWIRHRVKISVSSTNIICLLVLILSINMNNRANAEEIASESNRIQQQTLPISSLLFRVGNKNNLGRKYFELITDKIKVQTIQQINDYDKPTSFDTSVFSLIEILNILENSNINKKKLNKVTYSFLDEFTFYVNELHNDRFEDRKKPFLDANIRTLYILLSFGGELYTSSFRDIIFPLFKQKVEQEGFFDLIDRIDPDKEYYNDLIYHVSSYRLLDEIVPLNIVSQEEFIKSLFHNFMKDSSKDIDSLISLTSIIETFSNSDSYIRKKIFSYALDMYPKLKHPKSTFIAYIILENEDFVKKNFNNKIGAKLRQEIETLRPLKSGKINEILNQNENFLQNNELKTIQVFYSDSDGVLSLNSFIKTVKYHGYSFSYIDEDDLKVQIENPNHNMVSKLKGKTITAEKVVNGIRILHELRVYDSTYESFYIENFNKNSSYISWIHRGHSYHFNKTFDYHGENFQRDKPMILILGSCGSFNNVTNLFKRTKKDRFFATQGIGTLIINNSLILNLFESIANTKGDISWEKVSYDLKRDIFDKDKRGGEYQTPYSLPMRMLQLFNMGVEEN